MNFSNSTLKKVKQPGVKSRKICIHINVVDDNGIITCFDCSQQLEKGIFHDKEWRFFGHNDNKRNVDPNRVHMRKNDDRNFLMGLSLFCF